MYRCKDIYIYIYIYRYKYAYMCISIHLNVYIGMNVYIGRYTCEDTLPMVAEDEIDEDGELRAGIMHAYLGMYE